MSIVFIGYLPKSQPLFFMLIIQLHFLSIYKSHNVEIVDNGIYNDLQNYVKITKISYILLHCRNFLFKTQIIQQRIWKFCCYHLTRLFKFLIAWLRTNSFWKKKRKMESSCSSQTKKNCKMLVWLLSDHMTPFHVFYKKNARLTFSYKNEFTHNS